MNIDPKVIDRQIAALSAERTETTRQRAAIVDRLHYAVGDQKDYVGVGRARTREWNFSTEDVFDAAQAGKYHYTFSQEDVEKLLADYDAAGDRLRGLIGKLITLDEIFRKHQWSRFFVVQGGHIHRAEQCAGGTIRPTTQVGWLPELSGETVADAVEAHGTILCSHCFPEAPVEWTVGPKAKQDDNVCAFSGKYARAHQTEKQARLYRQYVTCPECGETVSVTSAGKARKHKK